MTYRGHICNGTVVLDQSLELPEGTEVDVEIRSSADSPRPSTLYERFSDLIGVCPDLPPDMAENHDRYLHGRDKK
ncbi:MAG: hypothetical protein ACHRHE_11635 [Tepidisphaerales bacterium]